MSYTVNIMDGKAMFRLGMRFYVGIIHTSYMSSQLGAEQGMTQPFMPASGTEALQFQI